MALFSDFSKVVLLSFSRFEWIKKEFIPCIELVAVRINRRIIRDTHEKIKGAIPVLTLHKGVFFIIVLREAFICESVSSISEEGFQGTTIDRRDTRWRSWLRHCAKSRKVAGPISDGVIGFFH